MTLQISQPKFNKTQRFTVIPQSSTPTLHCNTTNFLLKAWWLRSVPYNASDNFHTGNIVDAANIVDAVFSFFQEIKKTIANSNPFTREDIGDTCVNNFINN